MPSTLTFRNDAQPIAQVDTIVLGGTPAGGDTVYATINLKTVTYTVVGTMTAAEVALAFASLLAATQTAEFVEQAWTNTVGSPNVLVTAQFAGISFTLAVGKTGSITISSSTTTANKGPGSLADVNNWNGALPSAGDSVIFPVGMVNPVNMGLDALAGIALANVYFLGGSFGLPVKNPLGYNEYRPQEIQLDADNIYIGDGVTGVDYLRLQIPSGNTVCNVKNGQQIAANVTEPEILVRTSGGTITALSIETGGVGLATIQGQVATVTALSVGTDGPEGSIGASDEEAACNIGLGAAITAVTQYSGQTISNAGIATMTLRGGVWTQNAGNVGAVTNTGCQFIGNSNGTYGALAGVGPNAVFDFTGDTRAVGSLASMSCTRRSYFVDRAKRLGNFTAVLDYESAKLCDWGVNFSLSRT